MDVNRLLNDSLSTGSLYSGVDLARWGLIDCVLQEAARDRLIESIPPPPSALMAVLLRQWMEAHSLSSPQMLDQWLRRRQLDSNHLSELVSRSWRWQRWCESYAENQLPSYFLARKAGLDKVRYWHLTCSQKDLAAELYLRLRDAEITFEGLSADSPSLDSTDFDVQLIGPLEIDQASPELRPMLQSGQLGVLWSPRPTRAGAWQIVRIDEREPAALDDSMRTRLLIEIGDSFLQQHLWVDAAAPTALKR